MMTYSAEIIRANFSVMFLSAVADLARDLRNAAKLWIASRSLGFTYTTTGTSPAALYRARSARLRSAAVAMSAIQPREKHSIGLELLDRKAGLHAKAKPAIRAARVVNAIHPLDATIDAVAEKAGAQSECRAVVVVDGIHISSPVSVSCLAHGHPARAGLVTDASRGVHKRFNGVAVRYKVGLWQAAAKLAFDLAGNYDGFIARLKREADRDFEKLFGRQRGDAAVEFLGCGHVSISRVAVCEYQYAV